MKSLVTFYFAKKVIFVLGFLLVQIMYANASYLKPSIIN